MVFRPSLFLFAALAMMALLIVACGGGGGASGGASLNVTVTTAEFKFDPATINAAPGQTINLTVKNIGSIQHTWVLKAANVSLTIDPGQTVTKTFTAPAAGTYSIE